MTREEKREHLLEYGRKFKRDVQHMLDLDDKYPEVEIFGPQCISAEVEPGWVHLVDECLALLKQYGCKAGQIKQKFCKLVVYWDPPSWVAPAHKAWVAAEKPGPGPWGVFDPLKGELDFIAATSLRTCMQCGGLDDTDNAGRECGGSRRCTKCRSDKR